MKKKYTVHVDHLCMHKLFIRIFVITLNNLFSKQQQQQKNNSTTVLCGCLATIYHKILLSHKAHVTISQGLIV